MINYKMLGHAKLTGVLLLALSAAYAESSLAAAGSKPESSDTLTIYTAQKEDFARPIFDEFTKDTGIEVNMVVDNGPVLLEKLKTEGEGSPADVLVTVDVGNLWLATEAGVLAPTQSKVLEKNIPAWYRDSQNRWTGLSVRARTIVYNPQKVKASELSSYEDLATPKWKGRLCLRTSRKVYNQSLVASMIHHNDEEKTESVVKGWVANLAAPVFSSDTLLLKAIASGECHVGLSNTYYLARLKAEDPSFNVKVFWANQTSRGTHVNVMGAGVVVASSNKANAKKFLEWAVQPKAQSMFSNANYEFPILDGAEANELVKSWGDFKADEMPLENAGKFQRDAVKLMDRAGYR